MNDSGRVYMIKRILHILSFQIQLHQTNSENIIKLAKDSLENFSKLVSCKLRQL